MYSYTVAATFMYVQAYSQITVRLFLRLQKHFCKIMNFYWENCSCNCIFCYLNCLCLIRHKKKTCFSLIRSISCQINSSAFCIQGISILYFSKANYNLRSSSFVLIIYTRRYEHLENKQSLM